MFCRTASVLALPRGSDVPMAGSASAASRVVGDVGFMVVLGFRGLSEFLPLFLSRLALTQEQIPICTNKLWPSSTI